MWSKSLLGTLSNVIVILCIYHNFEKKWTLSIFITTRRHVPCFRDHRIHLAIHFMLALKVLFFISAEPQRSAMDFKLLLFLPLLLVLNLAEFSYPYNYTCQRKLKTLICYYDLPDSNGIPKDVTSVVIKEYQWPNFVHSRHPFKLKPWHSIRNYR